MSENEILAEIRATREELARRFHGDLSAIIEHLREGEVAAESAGRKVVSLIRPKRHPSDSTRVKENPDKDTRGQMPSSGGA